MSSPLSNVEFSSVGAASKIQVGLLLRSLPFLGFSSRKTKTVIVRASKGAGSKKSNRGSAKAATKRKQNPWDDGSVIDEGNSSSRARPSSAPRSSRSSKSQTKSSRAPQQDGIRILVSAIMPVEVEKVLETGEPASTPSWQTFASSLCGVWRGIGAAFSPATAEMEAIALGSQDEMLYDCRISSTVEECKGNSMSQIHRKTVWAVGNPLGEQGKRSIQVQEPFLLPQVDIDDVDGNMLAKMEEVGVELVEDNISEDVDGSMLEEIGVELEEDSTLEDIDTSFQSQTSSNQRVTADLESKGLIYDTVMEEDVLEVEPGLVFFEDGSYSRGPLTLLDGDMSSAPSYKIEQCLVRGGHTRLRLVHTIAVEGGGESVQLLRVAVYNEEWMGPHNMKSISDSGGHHLRLFSQHSRLKPHELVGSWKVFEVSATAIVADDVEAEKSTSQRPPYVYMSTETQKRRLLPEFPILFADEDIMDMQDATVMWLPGGISAYVDVKDDGTLTVGVGWYDNGVNIVMERDYNTEGKLSEVHYKSEVKGGWVGGRM